MDWFLTLEHRGRALYPKLREFFERPEYYKNEKVRGEVPAVRLLHDRKHRPPQRVPALVPEQSAPRRQYCDEPSFGGESGAYYHYSKALMAKYADHDPLESEDPTIAGRSVEYCSYIIEAVLTGRPFRLMGNVRNDGYITNLPPGCCVEVPTFADDTGLHPTRLGALPPQCAAACVTNVNVQQLTAHAALTGDVEAIVHAAAMDPLTGAVLTLNETREMCIDLLEAQRPWLPQFEGRSIRRTPTINIPADCRPVDVPLDPALAVVHRFGELIERQTS